MPPDIVPPTKLPPAMTSPPKKPAKTMVISGAAATVLAGLLAMSESSNKMILVPYYDQAGILTVCDGLTGDWIKVGKKYTVEECNSRKAAFIQDMSVKMGHCVGPMTDPQWIAWGHFTYNTGTSAFCKSGAAKLLKQGRYTEACASMKQWTWITKPGIGKVNCRISANRCDGIPRRRDFEYGLCMDAR